MISACGRSAAHRGTKTPRRAKRTRHGRLPLLLAAVALGALCGVGCVRLGETVGAADAGRTLDAPRGDVRRDGAGGTEGSGPPRELGRPDWGPPLGEIVISSPQAGQNIQDIVQLAGTCLGLDGQQLAVTGDVKPTTVACSGGKFVLLPLVVLGEDGPKALKVSTPKAGATVTVTKVFCSPAAMSGVPFAGGKGTSAEPYFICTMKQLDAIRFEVMASFALRHDLDASAWGSFLPIGTGGGFGGVFDGRGHVINKLLITSQVPPGGLFAGLNQTGLLMNLGLDGLTVDVPLLAGGLVGQNAGGIVRCFVRGVVKGTAVVGGLVGASSGKIVDSFASAAVSGTFTVGGLVGSNGGSLARVYAAGSVTATGEAGGLAGRAAAGSSTEQVFAVATVQATAGAGALIGSLDSGAKLLDGFFLAQPGTPSSCVAVGSATCGSNSALGYFTKKTNPPLASWDFVTVWQELATGLPTLRP